MGTTGIQPVRTALNRPRVTGDLLLRPQRFNWLNRRLERPLPLTLVVAPAGYGKITLISDWPDTWDGPSAWLSLAERVSDLNAVLTCFVAATHKLFPYDACPDITSLLKAVSVLVLSPAHFYARGCAMSLLGNSYRLVANVNAAIRLAYEELQERPRQLIWARKMQERIS